MFAPGIFKGAENEGATTVILHMVSQVLSGNVGCAALVWALDRKARAVVLMVLQRTDSMTSKNTDCTPRLRLIAVQGKRRT